MVQYFRQIIKIQYIKYLVSGCTGAIVNVGILYVLTDWLGLWYLFSTSISLLCSFVVSFTLHKFWTFDNKVMEDVHVQAASYLGVALINLVLNTFFMLVFVEYLHIWYLLAQVISAGLIAFSSFFLYKQFVFKTKTVV